MSQQLQESFPAVLEIIDNLYSESRPESNAHKFSAIRCNSKNQIQTLQVELANDYQFHVLFIFRACSVAACALGGLRKKVYVNMLELAAKEHAVNVIIPLIELPDVRSGAFDN